MTADQPGIGIATVPAGRHDAVHKIDRLEITASKDAAMRIVIISTIGLAIAVSTESASANPVQLLVYETSVDLPRVQSTYYSSDGSQYGPFTFGGNGVIYTRAHVTEPDPSQGGSVNIGSIGLGTTLAGVEYVPLSPEKVAIDGRFRFIIGQADATGAGWTGPILSVSGNLTGAIFTPSGQSSLASAYFNGVADSVTLNSFPNENANDLPVLLHDILLHPDHLHISSEPNLSYPRANVLDVILTFDPPTPTPVPEPAAVTVLVAGAAWCVARRGRFAEKRHASARH
jgi:hypothetical protein